MKANGIQQFKAFFSKIKSRLDDGHFGLDRLICKQGVYDGCAVLKLQKASWTNDRMDQVRNDSGIFFSIWLDQEAASKGFANYNIHALKLRHLKGYSITSRDFAADFRIGFAPVHKTWPNVSVDYGPLTLMQGWIEIDPARFERDVLSLMERFKHLSPMIDRLLESRRVCSDLSSLPPPAASP